MLHEQQGYPNDANHVPGSVDSKDEDEPNGFINRDYRLVRRPDVRRCQRRSWTNSMRVPKELFGCTKATIVPRDPGRGPSSITRAPLAFTSSSASAQLSTR